MTNYSSKINEFLELLEKVSRKEYEATEEGTVERFYNEGSVHTLQTVNWLLKSNDLDEAIDNLKKQLEEF